MNYTTLKEQVADHFVTTELVPFIPTAIELAEAEFNRRIRSREMIERSYTTLNPTASEPEYVALPTDFNAMSSIFIAGANEYRLEFVTHSRLRLDKERLTQPGDPCEYTIIGNELELLPVPSAAKELEIIYYKRIPALTDAAPTNWLIEKHPDIYLYGTLLQVTPYLDKDRRIKTWEEFYVSALEHLNLHDERATFPGGSLKSRAKAL